MITLKENLSYYQSATDSKSTVFRTLTQILDDIKQGTFKTQVDIVRSQTSTHFYKQEKRKLPMFTTSGVFSHRNDNPSNLTQYSNLLMLDFDKFPSEQKMLEFKYKLIQYASDVHLYAVFISPSGLGVKAVMLHDNTNPLEHERMFQQVKRDLFPNTDEFDMKCGNLSRTCFVSYDPNLFINTDPNLQPYPFISDTSITVPQRKQVKYAPYSAQSTQTPFHHTPQQLNLSNKFKYWDKELLGLTRDADKSLINYLDEKWRKQFPNAYQDGNRHQSILARAFSLCEAGVLIDAALNYFNDTFGRHGITQADIANMVNYAYNTNEENWGTNRSFLLRLRQNGHQKRIQGLKQNSPFTNP